MELFSGLFVGIVGSAHCAGMCGPLALALPVLQAGRAKFVTGRLLYNIGRVVTYVLLGAVAGLVGNRLFMAGAQQTVSRVLGVVLLVAALTPALLKRFRAGSILMGRITTPVQRAIGALLQRSSLLALFVLGLVNGLLPCGLVYVALAAAVTTGDITRGVLVMMGFGIGTVPVMFVIALLGKQIQGGVRKRLTMLMPAFTALIAVLIILRGMNLGIPYVSRRCRTSRSGSTDGGVVTT
jgi:sulfite exporter TauE/SafE